MTRLDAPDADTRIVGRPMRRVDGPLKVTGAATYAYENAGAGDALVGVFATATIGKGRIVALDAAAAEAMPGVRRVITHGNVIAQAPMDRDSPLVVRARPILRDARIDHFGQPVALAVAETFEQARDAAMAVVVEYEAEDGVYLYAEGNAVEEPEVANVGFPAATDHGDFDAGMAAAHARVDLSYDTPMHYSQPMEPHATLARWEGERLHLVTSCQTLANVQASLGTSLGLTPETLVIEAPFVGGGFGSKLGVHADLMGAAIASKMLGEPVKVCFTRQQMFTLCGGRPWHRQRVRLGADEDGRLIAIGHEALIYSADHDPFVEQTGTVTRSLYAGANRMTRHFTTHLDLPGGDTVRAPGELPGLLAVEAAMDELAEALEMDPVALRVLNDTDVDPESGAPLTGRSLAECLRIGAERFGWADRAPRPRGRREGQWLIGMGVAAAIRAHFQGATEVEVAVKPRGRIEVRSDLTDIGTGSYTILAQVAAEVLEIDPGDVDVRLGDSRLPTGGGSGGSWGASNTAAALHQACLALIERVGVGAGPGFAARALDRHPDGASAIGSIASQFDLPDWNDRSRHTYGAHFVEVAVHRLTGEIRVRRMLGVFAAGRILNPMTARSQLLGGMTWGLSAVLHEGAEFDARYGAVVNGDLAEYLVPVHADVPDIDVVLLDAPDLDANPVGVKGVAELGSCGSSAAVVNAIYNACGVRLRSFPVRLAALVAGAEGSPQGPG
jgi:xanthine dehydrogenase YagR molybdenum-binding subunit